MTTKKRLPLFHRVLHDAVQDEGQHLRRNGNVNWASWAIDNNVDYEALRKAITNERRPSQKIMEQCARTVGLNPQAFLEYRLFEARRALDPGEVGIDAAADALAAFESSIRYAAA